MNGETSKRSSEGKGQKKDLGEDTNATLHGDLGQEEVVGQKPLLEPSELEQPSEDRRLLKIKESLHD